MSGFSLPLEEVIRQQPVPRAKDRLCSYFGFCRAFRFTSRFCMNNDVESPNADNRLLFAMRAKQGKAIQHRVLVYHDSCLAVADRAMHPLFFHTCIIHVCLSLLALRLSVWLSQVFCTQGSATLTTLRVYPCASADNENLLHIFPSPAGISDILPFIPL